MSRTRAVMVTVTDMDADWKQYTYTVKGDPEDVARDLAAFVRRIVTGDKKPADQGVLFEEPEDE